MTPVPVISTEHCEVRVQVHKIELDGTHRLRPAAPDLGQSKFKAIRHVEARAVRLLCHRIYDRLSARFHDALNDETRVPRVSAFDVEVDFGEDRIVNLFKHRSVDLKECRAWFGVLTAHDAQNSLALRGARALIDDGDCFAVALMDRARPGKHACEIQPVELSVAVAALIDHNPENRLTVAVGRRALNWQGQPYAQLQWEKFRPLRCHSMSAIAASKLLLPNRRDQAGIPRMNQGSL